MKRVLSFLLAVSFILGMFVLALPVQAAPKCDGGSSCPSNGYSDVPGPSNWAHTGIDFCIDAGYMGSTSTKTLTFEPKTLVSRAMVASIMYRIAGSPSGVPYNASFSDVPSGKWFTTAIEWAAQNGLASGKGNGKFDPNGNVTRQELAVFMYKLAEYEGINVSGRNDLSSFADTSKVPSWAKMYVQWAVDASLISGKASGGKTYLAPTDNATRAEFASVVMRFVEQSVPTPPTPPTPVDPLVIVYQPKSVTVDEGNSATLSVSVTGGVSPYSYQWYKNGAPVVGATGASFSTIEAGSYTCTVSDSAGNSVTSNAANVTVNSNNPLVITKQPQGTTIEAGSTTTLSVSVSGGVPPYTYQWMNGGIAIAGATNSSYVTGEAGNFSCVVTDSKGNSVYSTAATVIVSVPQGGELTVTRQPIGGEISKGSALNISVGVAGGTPPYTYQWYKDGTAIPGATYMSYVATQAGKYFCAIFDATGYSVITSVAIVSVEAEKFDIIYDVVGSDSYLRRIGVENSNPEYYTSEEGLVLRNLSVDGYVFEGWYDGPGANAAQIKEIRAGETGTKYLYAHWSLIEYTVQFKSSLFLEEREKKYTVDKGAALPTPKLSNYVFVGWSDESGKLYSSTTIPAGTTGNITLTANWTSERNKTWTKPSLDSPIIEIDEKSNTILFVYEIGEIQNVPLYTIKDFGYIAGDGITKSEEATYSVTISESSMQAYACAVASATTESSNWTLSKDWNESTSLDKQWCEELGYTTEEAETRTKSETGNWNISSGSSGSTDTTTLTTNQNNWENQAKITSSDEHTESSSEAGKITAEVGVNYAGVKASVGAEISAETGNTDTHKSGVELGGTHGSENITTNSTVSSSSWNASSSYGGSNSMSCSTAVANTLSQRICSQYGYGKSYSSGGSSAQSQGVSSTQSASEEYSASVTYSTATSATKKSTWTTQATKPGYHRWIVAGTAHVFAVVGYDMEKQSYFVYTFSMMDDETHEFEDYSYVSANYDDEQNGVISFSVPYEVAEYVADLTSFSQGLKVDPNTGVITSYSGTDTCVVIPEYMNIGGGEVIKITGISKNAFRGNTDIVAVVLSDYITEIPSNAFMNCTSLVGLKGGSVTKIGDYSFSGCTGICDAGVFPAIEHLGINAFDQVPKLQANPANAQVFEATINSGAKRIVIYTKELRGGQNALSGKNFVVSEGTEYFELNGYGAEYKDVSITSNAYETVINKFNITNSKATALRISSEEITFNQIKAKSVGIAMILTADNARIGLQGTSIAQSDNTNALLCKNISLYESNPNTEGRLKVIDKILVCGGIENEEYLSYSTYEKISETRFNDLLNSYKLTFDANGGTCDETVREVANSTPIGTLPIPTKQYYTFAGWYLSDSTQVTSDTVFSSGLAVTVYAHWTPNKFTLTYDANGGTVSPSSKSMSYGQAIGSLPTPNRNYYTFNGWYTAKSGGTKVTESYVFPSDANVTIYAHWTENPVYVTGISIYSSPSKTSYYIGETLSTSGLKVKVYYNNETTAIISSGFSCSPTSFSSSGTKYVTVSYSGYSTSFSVYVSTPKITLSTYSESKTMDCWDYYWNTTRGVPLWRLYLPSVTTTPGGGSVSWSLVSGQAYLNGDYIAAQQPGKYVARATYTYCGYTYTADYTVTLSLYKTPTATNYLRSGPSQSYSTVTTVPTGATVYITEVSWDSSLYSSQGQYYLWGKTSYNGYSGWIVIS